MKEKMLAGLDRDKMATKVTADRAAAAAAANLGQDCHTKRCTAQHRTAQHNTALQRKINSTLKDTALQHLLRHRSVRDAQQCTA